MSRDKSLAMVSFEGELRALCEKHRCELSAENGEILVVFASDAEIDDPLEDVSLKEMWL